jgi:hypothetical protein
MNLEAVQNQLNKSAQLSRPPRDPNAESTFVKNDTFTTLKQSQIPNGVYEARLLPANPPKNPGLYYVQKHKILSKVVDGTDPRTGAPTQFPTYDTVLGSATNPGMTFLEPIVQFWNNWKRNNEDEYKSLPRFMQMAIDNLKGETYLDLPMLWKIDQVNDPFPGSNGKSVDWFKVTGASKKTVVGKNFQMKSKSLIGGKIWEGDKGSRKPMMRDGKEQYDGLLGLIQDYRDPETGESIDSLTEGVWLVITVSGKPAWEQTRYSIKAAPKQTPLAPELIEKYMAEENYPDVVARNQYYAKTNEEVELLFRDSYIYRELKALANWNI